MALVLDAYPDPPPNMSRTHSGGGNHEGPFDGVASSSQVSDDHGQVLANPRHIFEHDVWGTDLLDDTVRLGPKVALIIGAESLPGETEGLAGEAGRDDLHASTPGLAIKRSNIIPDGEGFEMAFFLAP